VRIGWIRATVVVLVFSGGRVDGDVFGPSFTESAGAVFLDCPQGKRVTLSTNATGGAPGRGPAQGIVRIVVPWRSCLDPQNVFVYHSTGSCRVLLKSLGGAGENHSHVQQRSDETITLQLAH
jgi:hypothetical protein